MHVALERVVVWLSSTCKTYLTGEFIKTWRRRWVGVLVADGKHSITLMVSSTCARRWFVLKGGKIFWFKSDIVTPVRITKTP